MSAVKQDTDNGVRHAIEVRGLDNRFGTQQVHQDLDLDVRRGEILGVVGGSGTGKSVLLRSVVGLQKPHSGVARIGGRDLLRAQWLARAYGAKVRHSVPEGRVVFIADRLGERRSSFDRACRSGAASCRAFGKKQAGLGGVACRSGRQVSGLVVRRHGETSSTGESLGA